MGYQTIILKKENNIATLMLNRPERLNALTEQMMEEISAALEEVASDEEVRVLIITGAGRAFCAGADLKMEEGAEKVFTATHPEGIRQALRESIQRIIRRLKSLDIPTIAMVNGVAVGGGFDLALACDLRVGSESCRFRVGFTSIGLIPGGGGTWHLPRIVGVPKAAELLFADSVVEAREAERLGLLNRLVLEERLEEETLALASKIASGPPMAIRMAKLQLYQGLKMDLDAALEFAAASQPILALSEDHKEGVLAFREKRAARFKGK
jgi:enoyl-CoA hydratase/carnithine racemase